MNMAMKEFIQLESSINTVIYHVENVQDSGMSSDNKSLLIQLLTDTLREDKFRTLDKLSYAIAESMLES